MTGSARIEIAPVGTPGRAVEFAIGDAMEILSIRSPGSGEVRIEPEGTAAELRFRDAIDPDQTREVTVTFQSRGRSSQIVVTTDAALASWAQTWYPIVGPTWAAVGTTRIEIPAGWQSISNGQLAESEERADMTVQTWVVDRPAARSFAAAPYTITTRAVGDRQVGVYLLEHANRASELLSTLTETLESLETRFGAYPYPGYALAEIPSGMIEWTGSSEQGFFMARSDALDGPPNLPLIAHELAHGWWGNWVRAVMPGSLMTGEALAQYGAVLAIEALEGDEAVIEFLRFSREGYNRIQSASGFWRLKIADHDRPLAELTGDGADNNLADAKGHWVYHMLRRRVGDDVFFGTLRELLTAHGGGTLSLPELRTAFVEAAPVEARLDSFFEQWLDRSGAPVISTDWTDASTQERHAVEVSIRQRTLQPYDIRMTIGVVSEAGMRLHEVALSENSHTVTLESDGVPTGIVENADQAILMWEAAYLPP